ncbi:PLP-dependent aminotransferase family protein [Actinomadura sp. DC4]|uniref:aminotransferase-like domain-containing protein n=1 Tax=Actinomadura sp. DC4 TaxID=3055069 RepID=UPI0025B2400E|nr:PLP-dependent aminotransferase family protein [Actinomadura sp. DC4]MDN3358157.1 PLP-dependent aminotransferase family protein [Actinomadura sp. DC4]
MNFLNEVANWYPDAVSFAAGLPYEELFDVDAIDRYIRVYRRHLAAERRMSGPDIRKELFQYGRTKGTIHRLVARHLEVDEHISVDPETIIVTVGCHEAMFLVLRALRSDRHDVVFSVTPTYTGFSGVARLVDLPVRPVAGGTDGVDLDHLRAQVAAARAEGLRPRACYVMPDFANPAGSRMSVETRRRLLAVSAEEGLLLLEDNPYGLFHDGEHRPALKALDDERMVVYLGSFAKSGLPGARVGYVVADQPVAGAGSFADELAKIKGTVTVNTSPIAQAVIGGKLLEHDCSLVAANAAETEIYRRNRRLLLDGLSARFGSVPGITWNSPSGGFFVVVTLPFAVDDELLRISAREHGVIWTPMSYFYENGGTGNQIRLACSLLTPDLIESGLERLAKMIEERLTETTPNDVVDAR